MGGPPVRGNIIRSYSHQETSSTSARRGTYLGTSTARVGCALTPARWGRHAAIDGPPFCGIIFVVVLMLLMLLLLLMLFSKETRSSRRDTRSTLLRRQQRAMLVTMDGDATSFAYHLYAHLNPKEWSVSVVDGKLVCRADEKTKLTNGNTSVQCREYVTKLSPQIDQSAPFEVRPGSYFEGIHSTAPGAYGKQHAGGELTVVFQKKIAAAAA